MLHFKNTPKNNWPSPAQSLTSRNLKDNIPVSYRKLKPKVVSFKDYRESVRDKKKYYEKNTKSL